jgi:hypothetical protein
LALPEQLAALIAKAILLALMAPILLLSLTQLLVVDVAVHIGIAHLPKRRVQRAVPVVGRVQGIPCLLRVVPLPADKDLLVVLVGITALIPAAVVAVLAQ